MGEGVDLTVSLAEEFGSDFFQAEGCHDPQVIFNKTLGKYLKVPCGKCLYCLRLRQSSWVVRLVEELRQNIGTSYFVTMTYAPECIPADPETGLMQVSKDDLKKLNADLRSRFQQGFFTFDEQLDIGRLKERIPLDKDTRFKYYITTEYGPDGGLPHAHSVYYNLPSDRFLVSLLFESTWKKGFCRVYEASPNTISYITKYLVNSKVCETYDPRFQARPFSLMSKRLGLSYVDRMRAWHQADPIGRSQSVYHGEKSVMPRYWREKIFDEDQRLLLQGEYEKKRSALDAKVSVLDSASLAALNHAREKWIRDQEYAAEQLTLKKHSL